MEHQPSALSPFRHPIFRAVWLASLASNFGSLIESVGAAWLMTSLGASAGMIALVQASTTLPIMLFSLAAGAIADNFDRRSAHAHGSGFPADRFDRPHPRHLSRPRDTLGSCSSSPFWSAVAPRSTARPGNPWSGRWCHALTFPAPSPSTAWGTTSPAVSDRRSAVAIVAAAGAFGAFAANAVSYVGLIAGAGPLVAGRPPQVLLLLEELGTAMAAASAMSRCRRTLACSWSARFAGPRLPFRPRCRSSRGIWFTVGRSPLDFCLAPLVQELSAVSAGRRLRRSLSIETIVRVGFIGFAVCVIGTGLSDRPFSRWLPWSSEARAGW